MEQDAFFLNQLAVGFDVCKAAAIDNSTLLASLFVAGLAGGAGHCAGMCGPFVLAQSVARMERQPMEDMREFHRLTGALLLPYHLGRWTTYAGLGALAAGMAGGVLRLSGFWWVPPVLLLAAAVFFFAYGLRRFGVSVSWLTIKGFEGWQRSLSGLTQPLFSRPTGFRGYGLGVALGFLPCGLLYGAVTAAGSAASALGGGLAMSAFVAGTVPGLVAIGVAGRVVAGQWRDMTSKVVPWVLMGNAALLAWMALRFWPANAM